MNQSKPKSRLRLVIRIMFWGGVLAGATWAILPNFQGRHGTRSLSSRAKADLRSLATALESYYLDNAAYPVWSASPAHNAFQNPRFWPKSVDTRKLPPTFALLDQEGNPVLNLTTPVPYLTSYFPEPFGRPRPRSYAYWRNEVQEDNPADVARWILWSMGPDEDYDLTMDNIHLAYDRSDPVPNNYLLELTYDPTNGSFSNGDLYRTKQ